MDASSESNVFGGNPMDSLDYITSINLPPLSTSIIASNVDTYSLTPNSFAYFSTIGRYFNTSADTETLPPPSMSKSFPPDESSSLEMKSATKTNKPKKSRKPTPYIMSIIFNRMTFIDVPSYV